VKDGESVNPICLILDLVSHGRSMLCPVWWMPLCVLWLKRVHGAGDGNSLLGCLGYEMLGRYKTTQRRGWCTQSPVSKHESQSGGGHGRIGGGGGGAYELPLADLLI